MADAAAIPLGAPQGKYARPFPSRRRFAPARLGKADARRVPSFAARISLFLRRGLGRDGADDLRAGCAAPLKVGSAFALPLAADEDDAVMASSTVLYERFVPADRANDVRPAGA